MTAPRDYFVSLRRGERTALLAGPFATHAEALGLVDRATDEANRVDPWAHFDAFGTCSLPAPSGYVGTLNRQCGVALVSVSEGIVRCG